MVKETKVKAAPKKEKTDAAAVKPGDKVKVEYTGTFDDGTCFDSTEKHGKPLEVEVGSGQIIKGFDKALIGMKKGEEKSIKLKPDEAYGDHNPEMIKEIPKAQFPNNAELQAGRIMLVGLPNGMQLPVKIEKVTEESVFLDLNHPLAGKTLNFKIKVVGINE